MTRNRIENPLVRMVLAGLAGVTLVGCDGKPFGANFSGNVDVMPRTPVAGAPGPAKGSETPTAPATPAAPKKGETPTPTAPGQSGAGINDKELKPGECFQAPANSVAQGDVVVDGVRYYDNNPRSGLIVQLGNGGQVCAPYGADVILLPGVDQAALNAVVGQAVEEMKANGCDPKPKPGCDTVNVVKLPRP